MLVLSRYPDQAVRVEGPCRIVVLEVRPGKVRLGIEALPEVAIYREELGPDFKRPEPIETISREK